MLRTINITMDITCIIFTLLLLIYLRLSQDRKESLGHLLGWICVFNIGMLLGDIPNWACEGFEKPWFPLALNVGTFILYLSGRLITWMYSIYICKFISTKTMLKKWFLPFINFMFAIDIIMLVFCVANDMYYIIDDAENVYNRGQWYWVSQSIPILLLLLDGGIILYYRKILKPKVTIAFLSYLMFTVIGITAQFFMYGISTTYFASTVSLYAIFLYVQWEQRLLVEKHKHELDTIKTNVMLSQIQPHFLYNSLQGIKLLCDTDPTKASEALGHFAFYLRGNLDSLVNSKFVTFKKELQHIKDYLFLEKMRLQEELDIKLQINYLDFMLPPLTVQSMIENAIRHGLSKKVGGGSLYIETDKVGRDVIILITDNGVGFDTSTECLDERTHIGIENTRRRIETLCNGSLNIESELNVGTKVKIVLPQKEENFENNFGG